MLIVDGNQQYDSVVHLRVIVSETTASYLLVNHLQSAFTTSAFTNPQSDSGGDNLSKQKSSCVQVSVDTAGGARCCHMRTDREQSHPTLKILPFHLRLSLSNFHRRSDAETLLQRLCDIL